MLLFCLQNVHIHKKNIKTHEIEQKNSETALNYAIFLCFTLFVSRSN